MIDTFKSKIENVLDNYNELLQDCFEGSEIFGIHQDNLQFLRNDLYELMKPTNTMESFFNCESGIHQFDKNGKCFFVWLWVRIKGGKMIITYCDYGGCIIWNSHWVVMFNEPIFHETGEEIDIYVGY